MVETQHSDPNNSRSDMDLFIRKVSCIHPRRPFYILDDLSPGKMPKCFFTASCKILKNKYNINQINN